MIVSWNWLTDYLRLDMPVEVLTERLALTGLNHESIDGGRRRHRHRPGGHEQPARLPGHIGIAREISVLFDKPLRIPTRSRPRPGPPVETLHRGGRSRRPNFARGSRPGWSRA